MDRTRTTSLAGALALALCLAPGVAGAAKPDPKKACVEAYNETQAARKSAKLRAAREQAVICAQDACPTVVRKDCAGWLGELDQSLPTVVLAAKDPTGQETSAVKVTVDGEAFAARVDGKALPLDPGDHAFRFEIEGAPPPEQRVVIREGEKNRRIEVSFVPVAPAVAGTPGAVAPPPEAARSTPTAVWVVGGVSVLALGIGATLDGLGLAQKGSLDKSCAPNCTADQVRAVRTKLVAGDISLMTGIVAAAVATTIFFVSRSTTPAPSAPTALRFDLQPLPGGGTAMVGGRF